MSSNEEEKDNVNKQSTNNENTIETKIELQLGDIIKIISPNNERLNEQDFFH